MANQKVSEVTGRPISSLTLARLMARRGRKRRRSGNLFTHDANLWPELLKHCTVGNTDQKYRLRDIYTVDSSDGDDTKQRGGDARRL